MLRTFKYHDTDRQCLLGFVPLMHMAALISASVIFPSLMPFIILPYLCSFCCDASVEYFSKYKVLHQSLYFFQFHCKLLSQSSYKHVAQFLFLKNAVFRISTDKKGESTKSPLPLFLTTKSLCSGKSKTGNVNGMAPRYPS